MNLKLSKSLTLRPIFQNPHRGEGIQSRLGGGIRVPKDFEKQVRRELVDFLVKFTLNSLHMFIELLLLCEFRMNRIRSKATRFFENHLILKAYPGSSESRWVCTKEERAGMLFTCRMFETTLAYPMNCLLSTDMKMRYTLSLIFWLIFY